MQIGMQCTVHFFTNLQRGPRMGRKVLGSTLGEPHPEFFATSIPDHKADFSLKPYSSWQGKTSNLFSVSHFAAVRVDARLGKNFNRILDLCLPGWHKLLATKGYKRYPSSVKIKGEKPSSSIWVLSTPN